MRQMEWPATTRRSDRRQLADLVLARAAWVDAEDRMLLEQVLGRGVRPRELATLMRCSTRTVQRRVRQLVRRLTDRTAVRVLREHRDWRAETAAVALAFYLRRHTLRQIAGETGLTLHQVRMHLQRARGMLESRPH